jgi:hypothetical protein
VGSTPGAADLINSGVLPGTQYSYQPPGLPAAMTLYVTLFVKYNGHWDSYTSFPVVYWMVGRATFTSPLNGHVVSTAAPCCRWTTVPNAQAYYLVVGSTPGTANLVNSGILPTTQSCYPANCSAVALPKGKLLYGTIFTEIGGSWSAYQSITFSA